MAQLDDLSNLLEEIATEFDSKLQESTVGDSKDDPFKLDDNLLNYLDDMSSFLNSQKINSPKQPNGNEAKSTSPEKKNEEDNIDQTLLSYIDQQSKSHHDTSPAKPAVLNNEPIESQKPPIISPSENRTQHKQTFESNGKSKEEMLQGRRNITNELQESFLKRKEMIEKKLTFQPPVQKENIEKKNDAHLIYSQKQQLNTVHRPAGGSFERTNSHGSIIHPLIRTASDISGRSSITGKDDDETDDDLSLPEFIDNIPPPITQEELDMLDAEWNQFKSPPRPSSRPIKTERDTTPIRSKSTVLPPKELMFSETKYHLSSIEDHQKEDKPPVSERKMQRAITVAEGSYPQETIGRVLPKREPSKHLPSIFFTIHLVDGSFKKIVVTQDFTVWDIMVCFANKMDLWQTELFALSVKKLDGTEKWLDPDNSIITENLTPDSNITFKIKHWKRPKSMLDPVAIHLYFLQIHDVFVSGTFPCSSVNAMRLAAYNLQILYGNFDPEKHKLGYFDSASILSILPKVVVDIYPVSYLEKRIFDIYSQLKGIPTTAAETKYIEIAQDSIPLLGTTLFQVFEDEKERRLGVAEDGVLISKKDDTEYKTFDFYPFEEIGEWKLISCGLQIHITNPDKKPLFQFTTSSSDQICELMCDYYKLLQGQVLKGLPWTTLPWPYGRSRGLPSHTLYKIPRKRRIIDPNFSRLELVKHTYLQECGIAGDEILQIILDQIDDHLLSTNEEALTTMNISNCNLDREKCEVLVKALSKTSHYKPKVHLELQENFKIDSVDLSGNVIEHSYLSSLMALIETSFLNLKILNLNGTRLGIKGGELLSKTLKHLNHLEQLFLSNNQLSNKGTNFIILSLKNKKLTHLSLDKNILDSKIAPHLGELIQDNDKLESLSIGKNKFDDNGIVELVKAFRRMPKRSIQHLNLSETGLSSGGKYFSQWLEENTQLVSLRLFGNRISDKIANAVVNLVSRSRHLLHLDLSACGISSKPMLELCTNINQSEITDLLLSGNSIGKKIGVALCNSLKNNKKLMKLGLRNCSLSKNTLIEIIRTIKSNQDMPLAILDLGMNDLSSNSVVEEVASLLTFAKYLEDIILTRCQINHHGMSVLGKSFIKNEGTLRRVQLDSNKIGKWIEEIAEGIKKSKIEELSLRNCDISGKDLQHFMELVGNQSKLTHMALEKNNGVIKQAQLFQQQGMQIQMSV